MSKVLEATTAIKAAWDKTRELVNAYDISIYNGVCKVAVNKIRDLEQIPGEYTIEARGGGKDYPWEAVKEYDGVRFFCLLEQAEYEELQQAS